MSHTGTYTDRINRVQAAFEEQFDNIKKISNTPEGSEWNDEIYGEFLREAPVLDRQSLDGAAGHAMHFWRWYSGLEEYQKEYTYPVFHGVLSYVKLDGTYVLLLPKTHRLPDLLPLSKPGLSSAKEVINLLIV